MVACTLQISDHLPVSYVDLAAVQKVAVMGLFASLLLVLCGMCEVGMYRYGVCKTIISVVIDEIKTISIYQRRFKSFTVIIFTASFFRRFNFSGLLSLKVITLSEENGEE